MTTMNEARRTWACLACTVVMAVVLSGCASSSNRAPVEDRRAAPAVVSTPSAVAVSESADKAVGSPPAADNSGKPGYYTVKPSDTLVRIALENGQNWKDLVRWNGLENPNLIEVGQVLRVVPPGTDPTVPGVKPVVAAKVETRPLDARSPATSAAPTAASGSSATVAPPTAQTTAAVSAAAVASGAPPAAASAPGAVAAQAPAPAAPVVATGDDAMTWIWPASGTVTTAFDENKSKGLAIAGKAGDPVLAAADGRVVYAGSGLRGYGNLVIVKHNSTYLTAYAHNQTLLVKEDQAVRRGQKIAEMGSTDAERVQLHFEIRKQGKPIDPARLLPVR